MRKNLLKIIIIFLFMSIISGCGKIPDSLREDEKNYKQMLEERFKEDGIEFNIINDKKAKGIFTYEFKENDVDVHIIDVELKDDPTFKFRICTGFSEVPTFKVEYDHRTNYNDIIAHKNLEANFQNSKHINLSNEMYTKTYYSKECAIDHYKNTLIFNENSSVEEIAQELASYEGVYASAIHFEYGDVSSCLNIYNRDTYEHYVKAINDAIEDYNDDGSTSFCR